MTNLSTFARKLMRINERVVASNTPSAIFGSIGDLPQAVSSRARLRIGLFPCISENEDDALIAMGAWSVLAYLLEHWRDIEVYRLFVRFEVEPEDFVWTMDKSQFTVRDWDIEHLDENIGIEGVFKKTDSGIELITMIDNDNLTGQDAESVKLTTTATSTGELFAKLPELAQQIAATIDANRVDNTDPAYPADIIADGDSFNNLLELLLEWDVNLLASLWGVERDDDDVNDDFEALLEAGKDIGTDFAAWATAKAIAQTMRPGYSVIGDALVDRVPEVTGAFESNYSMPILAGSIFNMGFAQKSYHLLEDEVENRPKNTIAWLKLTEVLAEGGLFLQAIDKFQSAIEQDAVNSPLFRAYGNVLLTAERAGQEVTSYVLIDLSEYDDYKVAWEAIEAYGEALKLDPTDVTALYARVLQLTEVDFEQNYLWDEFAKLVEIDTEGEYIADVIDNMYDVNDIQPGVDALNKLITQYPERVDIYMNLAALHIAAYDGDSALPLLEKAKSMTDAVPQLAEIERLTLTAENPEFEYRFGEISSILDAANKLSADDVEFLEDVVEKSPHLIESHIALGQSYYYWQEYDEALEVLLDVQEKFPDQPLVLDWLARILWESGERDTAFTYLNSGIEKHPFNVQLIARAGQYLFDNEQLEDARKYLARAEEIAPRHPMLASVRGYIARKMSENPTKYKES